MYWEFVQTGRADNITVLKPDDYSAAEVQQLLHRSMPESWLPHMEEAAGGAEELQQLAAKLQLQEQARGEFDTGDVVERGVGKTRLVRDYLWIVQENHGMRDYCDM